MKPKHTLIFISSVVQTNSIAFLPLNHVHKKLINPLSSTTISNSIKTSSSLSASVFSFPSSLFETKDDDFLVVDGLQKESKYLVDRKLYKLETCIHTQAQSYDSYQIEEHLYFAYKEELGSYESTGIKRYILRGPPNLHKNQVEMKRKDGLQKKRVTAIGDPIFFCDIMEIKTSSESTMIGTGYSSWDSSIAMSLFFKSYPSFLKGHVLELGSGIGVGGILSTMCAGIHTVDLPSENNMKSITLTDLHPTLLKSCSKNARLNHFPKDMISVKELDWYDTDSKKDDNNEKYDTIIGADLAYLFPDIKPLAHTIVDNMKRTTITATQSLENNRRGIEEGKAFMIGPYNRDAMRHLETVLEEDPHNMNVETDLLELITFELDPVYVIGSKIEMPSLESEANLSEYTYKTTSEFLIFKVTHNSSNNSRYNLAL